MYGIKVSLLLTPVVVGVIIVGAAVLGTLLGATPDAANFTLFFLMVCMGRLFSHSLSMSIEGPVTKILYQPIDKSKRYDAQSKIDGTVNEFSSVLSGLILIGLSKFPSFQSLHINYIVILIIAVWCVIIVKLYKGYRNTLQDTLNKGKESEEEIDDEQFVVNSLNSELPDKVIYSAKVLQRLNPILFEKQIEFLIKHPAPKVREYTIKVIKESKIYDAIPTIRKRMDIKDDSEIEDLLLDALETLYLNQEEALTYDYLEMLARSRQADKRQYAAKLIGKETTHDTIILLSDLLRDLDSKVRLSAITTASKINNQLLYSILIDNLGSNVYRGAAQTALLNIGEDVITSINDAYQKSDITTEVQVLLLNILGEIGGERVQSLLVDKLLQASPILIKDIVTALRKSGFQSDEINEARINKLIQNHINAIIWNMAAIEEVDQEIGSTLVEALLEENKQKFDYLFLLLSLNYEPSSIEKIKESIDIGTVESIGYAIELLDLFVADELKSYLFPLLEDSPVSDKLKQLEIHFFRSSYDEVDVLIELMSRDYNLTDSWTKTCAVICYGKYDIETPDEALIACLFNPDTMISEAGASVLFSISPEYYHSCGARLKPKVKRSLDLLVASTTANRGQLIVEKVFQLKKIPSLEGLTWQVLAEFSKIATIKNIPGDQVLLTKDDEENSFYILQNGVVVVESEHGCLLTISKPSVISDVLLLDTDDDSTLVKTLEDTVLFEVEEYELLDFINRYPQMIDVVIENIKLRLEEEPLKTK